MKHIKLFESFLLLEKEELRFSQTAYDQIMSIINKIEKKRGIFKDLNTKVKELLADKSITENDFKIKMPLREVVYPKSIKIKIGLLIRGLVKEANYNGPNSVKIKSEKFGFSDRRIKQLVEMFKIIVNEKRIPEDAQIIINDMLDNDIEDLQLLLDPYSYHPSSYQDQGNILTLQVSYLQKILRFSGLDEVESEIRHELRHATQIINNELLATGSNFFIFYHYIEDNFKNISSEKGIPKINIDPFWKKINIPYDRRFLNNTFEYKFNLWFKDFVIGTGTGFYFDKKEKNWKYHNFGKSKTKTNFKQKIGYIDKNHVLDDIEYHTRIGDYLDEYINKNKGIINRNDVNTATDKIFKKIQKNKEYIITKNIKKEAPKDYYLFLKKRIEKIKNKHSD